MVVVVVAMHVPIALVGRLEKCIYYLCVLSEGNLHGALWVNQVMRAESGSPKTQL